MTQASICTIGDEILIGQILDTNSSVIARTLEENGVMVTRMLSIGDDHDTIIDNLRNELEHNQIVISTGGLGPTKDDITKAALAELSGSKGYVMNEPQLEIVHRILKARGLDVLDINRAQALVPDTCEVIPNQKGTAPVMVFRFPEERFGHPATLYSLPGVPFEAIGALPDVVSDIKSHNPLSDIFHKCIMVSGMAESALSKKIEDWEDNLPSDMHLAYLPNQLTGVRLRLSIYGGNREEEEKRIDEEFAKLRPILGDMIYSYQDDTLQNALGSLFRGTGMTISAAESCTGGMIASLITSVPGASEYFLGSVTSYAIAVKQRVLDVHPDDIISYGVVSSEVAASMADGVRKLTGSTYAVATTGLAGPGGDDRNPVGTVWIGLSGPNGTTTLTKVFKNDRKTNIERFSSAAIDALRLFVLNDLKH
ncbi:MAG: CinA family nicotinamide mononucleotide deamidase-related protein [Bacteroidales bacterium]|nr:CinA family nicotinamide mononucleotide deamidase-related protein [Bacteroidales bacterium]